MAETSTAAKPTPAPVSLFYSYAHEDEPLRIDLERHLRILQLRQQIQPWHDRKIVPGQLWDQEIHQQLQRSELVLLLLSSYFMGSDYILGVELKTALQRARDGSATVVPILLRPVDLEGLDSDDLPLAPLLQRQGLPRDLKAVTSWRQREEAWVSVSKGLRATVEDIQARRPPLSVATKAIMPPPAPATTRGASGQAAMPPPTAAAAADPLLDAVLASTDIGILTAQRARNCPDPDAVTLRGQAMALLSIDHLPRVLWVDDQPEGNQHETDMLARLQIELVQVRSTDEALALLQHDKEGFDLVVSDWNRRGERADAGLRLQQAMRHLGLALPLVIYHGEFEPTRRQLRTEAARRAGVFGEAVVPMELLGLVQAALTRAD